MRFHRQQRCDHHWTGWWIEGDVAVNDCLFCPAQWTERLAVPVLSRPLRRLRLPRAQRES